MKSAFKKLSVNKHNIDAGLLFAVTLCAAISTLLIYSISESGLSANEGVGSSYWKTQLFFNDNRHRSSNYNFSYRLP